MNILWVRKRDVSVPFAISSGSRTFRFHAQNNGTHDSLQKSHNVRRNFFAYYVKYRFPFYFARTVNLKNSTPEFVGL